MSVPLAGLRRIARTRQQPAAYERCEMCAAPISDAHSHVVDLRSRALMCSCRSCYLLFTDQDAHLHFRAVPERYLSFDELMLDGLVLDGRAWDELQIPVGLAFLFRNSVQERTVAFYPGPAGATESDLPMDAWDRIVAQNPALAVLRPDVEALLVRRDNGRTGSCHLVPIDACYELVGQLRTLWRGFDGGSDARAAIDAFFAQVHARSRPAAGIAAP